jgi:Flp pilus assembly protein TadD
VRLASVLLAPKSVLRPGRLFLKIHNFLDLHQEPAVSLREVENLPDGETGAEGMADEEDALGVGHAQLAGDDVAREDVAVAINLRADTFLLVTLCGLFDHVLALVSRRSKRTTLPARSDAPDSRAGDVLSSEDSSSQESTSRWASLKDRWAVPGVCVFLAAIVWAIFGQTLHYEFVNFDDDDYVYENPEVAQGLTLRGIVWAFTHFRSANWHPLTWISHMVDCQFYGLDPGGHHLTNVLLHTASAILLFLVMRRMTGFPWRSAFVAAVFAVHPLRVESVAWVAERKDVLSGVFFMLTIAAYVRYARRPWSLARYGLVLFLFALGLMCKPMLVTLPLVLLLLDYWPLNRTATAAGGTITDRRDKNHSLIWKHLILEKLPLFGLAFASGVVTIFAQAGTIELLTGVSFPLQVGNALISWVAYVGQMFWPSDLTVLYPFAAARVGISRVVLSSALLAAISTGVFVLRRHRPYFLVGWLWYLIMLVPVSGILQVGFQARADRYTYLPQIGLYIFLTWLAVELTASWRNRHWVCGIGALVILAALIASARTQTAYWLDSETLWTRALACTRDNRIAHNSLGNVLLQKGNVDEAIPRYQRALEIDPNYAQAHNNLGTALFLRGDVDGAISHYQRALQIKPDDAEARLALGNALLQKGNADEAISQYQRALETNPGFAEAHNNLGNALFRKGNMDEARTHYQRALQIEPGYAVARFGLADVLLRIGSLDEAISQYKEALQITPNNAAAHCNLGQLLLQKGSAAEAISHYQKALEIKTDYAKAQNNLAWVLATCSQASLRNANKALALSQRANELTGNANPAVLRTLAAAYAEAGQFPEAVATAERALQLAETQSDSALADALRSEMKLYRAGIPFRLN